MNYLAHTLLSKGFDGILTGNFIADAVKGNQVNQYRKEIIEGIELHRRIDTFVDRHESFVASRKRLGVKYGRYSSVSTDFLKELILETI